MSILVCLFVVLGLTQMKRECLVFVEKSFGCVAQNQRITLTLTCEKDNTI